MNIDSNAIKLETANSPAAQNQNDSPKTGFLKWLPLLVMSLALTIIILDTTILNVTLRTIVEDLHTTLQKIQWVITAYSLMLAAFTITGGRLGDLFGRKKMFIIGAIIFAIGSFMTSIAHSVGFMIAGEAIVEGIGACLMMPATLSLLRSNYKGRDMQLAFGIWGGIVAGAAALGPVIGGWFTTHYTWRWAFRVNVVVAIILVATSVFIQEYRDKEEKPTIDFVGVFLSALGMLSMVFGFIQATTYGWLKQLAPLTLLGHTLNLDGISATPLFILLGLIILGVFLWWEAHMEKAGKTPLVSPSLFANKTFMTGSGVSAILSLGQAGLSFAIPIYLQAVLKLDPIHTGIAMIPMTAVILIAAPLSAWVSKYISPKHIIQVGIVLDALGFIVLRQSLHVGASQWALAPGFSLFGIGLGLMMAQSSNLTLSAVSVEQSGEASGVTNTLRSLGQTLGSAIIGAVLLSSLAGNITTGIKNSSVIPEATKPAITQAVSSQTSNLALGSPTDLGNQIPPAITRELTLITNQATVDGGKTAMSYGLIFILLALLVSSQLPKGNEVEAESLAHQNENEMVPKKRARHAVLAVAIVVAVGAGAGGYYIAKHKFDQNAAAPLPAASSQQAVQGSSSTSAAINQNPPGITTGTPGLSQLSASSSEQMETTKIFSSTTMHFSIEIPQSWSVKETTNEVMITTPDNQQYSIQEYPAPTNDENLLQQFLSSQPNIHNITNVQINGLTGLFFEVSGIYGQGVATLQDGRLYYLLGNNIQNNPAARTFKVI